MYITSRSVLLRMRKETDKSCREKQNTCFICVIKTNLISYWSSVCFVSQPLHVSGIFVAHRQEVYCICTQQLWPGWDGTSTRTVDSQIKSTTRTNFFIYTVYLLMMGYKYARNMYRLTDEINWGQIVHQVGVYHTDESRRTINKTFNLFYVQ